MSESAAGAALTIEKVSIFYAGQRNGGSVFFLLRNSGTIPLGQGVVWFRTYTSDLVVLNDFFPESKFSLIPGEKEQLIAGDSQSPMIIHFNSFTESKTGKLVPIGKWFSADSEGPGFSESKSVNCHPIESPL